jgi:hypothetical protein
MSPEQKSRRRFPRLHTESLILVKKTGEAGPEELTKTTTLGLGGCLIVREESYGEGALLELTLGVKHRVVKACGRVVYEIPQINETYHVGVEFTQIDPEDLEVLKSLFTEGTVLAAG